MKTHRTRGASGLAALAGIGLIVGVIVLGQSLSRESEDKRAAVAAADAQKKAEQTALEVARKKEHCTTNRDSMLAQHAALTKAAKHWDAARVFEDCADTQRDEGLRAMIVASEIAHYQSTGKNAKLPPTERIEALRRLVRDYPTAASGVEARIADLEGRVQAYRASEERRAAAREREERRKRGVTIGMSTEEVLQSSWGRPVDINRTRYSWGVKEQWVYDGGYLYFTDGKLDAISN